MLSAATTFAAAVFDVLNAKSRVWASLKACAAALLASVVAVPKAPSAKESAPCVAAAVARAALNGTCAAVNAKSASVDRVNAPA